MGFHMASVMGFLRWQIIKKNYNSHPYTLITIRFSILLISIPLYLPLILSLSLNGLGITWAKWFAALIMMKFQLISQMISVLFFLTSDIYNDVQEGWDRQDDLRLVSCPRQSPKHTYTEWCYLIQCLFL